MSAFFREQARSGRILIIDAYQFDLFAKLCGQRFHENMSARSRAGNRYFFQLVRPLGFI
jgi:hypothetical protein